MTDPPAGAPAVRRSGAAPMRVVISRWGSTGDVLPYLAVGWALASRGHDVTFVANPYYEPRAREAGLAFVPIGRREDHEQLMSDPDVWDRHRKSPEQIYHQHYYPYLPSYFDAVTERAAGPRTVVISGDIGGIMAAERVGAPFVSIAVSPATSRYVKSRYDPPHPERVLPAWATRIASTGVGLRLLYRLNTIRHRRRASGGAALAPPDHPIMRLRAAQGLPRLMTFGPRLALCLWPDWFAPPQRDWPATARVTGFPFYPPPTTLADTSGPAGDGPIVATTGSLAGSQFRFYEIVVEACRLLDRPAVLISPHRQHIPASLPPKITYVAFAPFSDLLSRASLVIHHGGIGTASYALAAGVPQISLPMRGDQFDNGNRLQRLGVGTMLAAASISPQVLARTIATLTSSSRIARRCQYWQSRTDTAAGVSGAADAIESIV